MTTEKKQLLDKTFQLFMDVGFSQENLSLLDDIVAKDVVGFGTAIDEKLFGIKELQNLLVRQKVQSAGMETHWKINTLDVHISSDENTAIYTNDLQLYLAVDGNPIEMYMRFSVVLEYVLHKWLVVHWHGSKPEQVESEKDTWGIETWKAKAEALEKEVAERTSDLVEKNRELEIETALERVRSTSLAMHSSNDLGNVVYVVFTELVKLDAQLDRCLILIVDPQKLGITWYLTGKEGLLSSNGFLVPDNTHPSHQAYLEGWRTRRKKWHYLLAGEEKQRWDTFGFAETELAQLPDFIKADMAAVKAIHLTISSDDFGCLIASSLSPLSDAHASIVERFTIVFNQTYTRFLDLQKAEAQAREAQIEAALERVRSRSMAMHKSEELPEVIQLVFEQLKQLNFNIDSAQFDVNFRESDDLNMWTAIPGQPYPTRQHIPYFNNAVVNSVKNAKEAGLTLSAHNFTFEEKNEFFNHFFKHTSVPEERREFILSLPGWARSVVYLDRIYLGIQNYSGIPYSEAEHTILGRFAKVFEQTYARFLDLQKAEAQAREAQIEAALERVRAKTMAMHKSEQLPETAQVLFEQFAVLGKTPDRMSIGVYNEELGVSDWWVTDQEGIQIKHQFTAPLQEPTLTKMFSAWKEGKESIVIELEGDDLKEWVTFVRQVVKMPMDESQIKGRRVHQAAFFSQGQLLISSHEALPVETVKLLVRFAKVFSQTYTRFLDLQKAEAQAREAQIEAALERVRSRSMAMQKSGELSEVKQLVLEQLQKLTIKVDGFSLLLDFGKSKDWNIWAAVQGVIYNDILRIPYIDHPQFNKPLDAYRAGLDFHTGELSFEEKNQLFEHYFRYAQDVPEERKKYVFSTEGMSSSAYFLKNSVLQMHNFTLTPYTDAENEVLKRIAYVFDQAYTRFLDLQKAEAQAREAQIEAALERVRAVAMSMMKSDDLLTICQSVFTQLQVLGFENLRTAQIYIRNDGEEKFMNYDYATVTGAVKVEVNYNSHSNTMRIYDVIRNAGDDLVYNVIEKEKLDEWKAYLYNTLRQQPEESLDAAEGLHYYLYSFGIGAFGICTFKAISTEELDILKRFRNVFNLSYQRYADLALAEAQLRDTIKRASVDRVRAEIASMRTTSDLERIQPLIWNELKILGVPFIRCGVFIMDEDKQELQAFLSTPDGKSIAAFHLPYYSTEQSKQIVGHWQQKQVFSDHMDEAAFAKYTKNLVDQGAVASDGKYVTENRPKDLYLHFLPFLQGMLYVGNDTPLKEDELELVQNLADAFSTAYARYEDFNKLEAAKNEVDKTLQELKVTQGQLIQAEKLASLGQLTAGIAHEIKNPLNFINNFSEVSAELIDEVLAEIQLPGTPESIDEWVQILNSVKSNLNIIHQHGSRADGIVKSMLMHSRSSTGRKEPVDLNGMIRENVNLAFHAMRAGKDPIQVETELLLDDSVGEVPLIIEDFSRVILNLCNNAFDAMRDKSETLKVQNHELAEGKSGQYVPKLTLRTKRNELQVTMEVEDNGPGIPEEIRDKILQPFFTTKKGTQGTGLGLSITHDIIKAHGGTLEIETESGKFSKFIISII